MPTHNLAGAKGAHDGPHRHLLYRPQQALSATQAQWNRWPSAMRRASSLIAVVRGGVQLGLLADRKARELVGIEEVIARQMRHVGHALDAGLGHLDRLEPDAELVGAQAAQPLAGGAAVARAAGRIGTM